MPVVTGVPRLQKRRTKIVATLGPSTEDPQVLEELLRAGVNVFRLNLSHGGHDLHADMVRQVRRAAQALGATVGILADLGGPKIRAGLFRGGAVEMRAGEMVTVTTRDVLGEPGLIPSQYPGLARDVGPGDRILLDDGALELEVLKVEGTEVQCRVVTGGTLKDRKGMNLPGVAVSAPALTEKDRLDAGFALDLGVDFLALSFVRRASDLEELRELRDSRGGEALLVAKIEKLEALDRVEEILEASDGIMVARGDLGVELPPEKVPIVQSQLVALARQREKPVIVATQMLESMVRSPRPTRAEVMDVFHAVYNGADAVMLAAETASGAFPVQAVETMDRVIREAEGYLWERQGLAGGSPGPGSGGRPVKLEEAVARATSLLSWDLMVKGIVVYTRSGWTAGKVSAGRPQAPILAAMTDPVAQRRTTLFWGVEPVLVETLDPDPSRNQTRQLVREHGLAQEGDYVLEVRGFQWDPKLNVPTISVCRV